MSSFRWERFGENLKREMSFLIRNFKKLKDDVGNFSVSRVEVSGRGSRVLVFISSINGFKDALFVTQKLNGASGFFRREISSRFRLKRSPEIEFVADDYVSYSDYLGKVFDKIKNNDEVVEEGSEPDGKQF